MKADGIRWPATGATANTDTDGGRDPIRIKWERQ